MRLSNKKINKICFGHLGPTAQNALKVINVEIALSTLLILVFVSTLKFVCLLTFGSFFTRVKKRGKFKVNTNKEVNIKGQLNLCGP
jgi:hypothetical protein